MSRRSSQTRFRTAIAVVVIFAGFGRALRAQNAGTSGSMDAGASTDTSAERDARAVQPERPTVATHAGTVAPGWLELEAGGEWDRLADRSRRFQLPSVLKIGVGRRAQFDFIADATKPSDASVSIGDIALALKLRLAESLPLFGDFAVQPGVKLPTASASDGGTGTTDFGLLLISSHELGSIDMDINVGGTARSGNGSRAPRTSTLWTVSFGIPVTGALGIAAELYGYPGTGGLAGEAPIVAILAGPTYTVRKYFAIDAGIIEPVAGPQPRAIYGGLVWNIGCALPAGMCRRVR